MKEFRKVDEYIKDKNNLNLLGFMVDMLGKIIYEHTDLTRRTRFNFEITNALESQLEGRLVEVPNESLEPANFYIIPNEASEIAYKVVKFEDKALFDFMYNKITDKREFVFYSNTSQGLLFAKLLPTSICASSKYVTDMVLLVSDIEHGLETLNVPLARFAYKNHHVHFLYIEECERDCVILTIKPKKKRPKKKRRKIWTDSEK